MGSTKGQIIKCRAAVLWEVNKPLVIENIEVDPPGPNEVRVKIIANGVCRSDLSVLFGLWNHPLPVIVGHEATGQVESVGPGVTYVKKGDLVIPSINPQCNDCKDCRNFKKTRCPKLLFSNFVGLMSDGTSRVRCKGKDVRMFFGVGSFSEYSVVHVDTLTKLPYYAPLEKVCMLGCGVGTGLGAAINDARVEPGSTCAVWGLGAIGLAAIMGCKRRGASRIIAIDINAEKEKKSKGSRRN